eukprot:10957167-Alexandrium_andersonii.AAC.1
MPWPRCSQCFRRVPEHGGGAKRWPLRGVGETLARPNTSLNKDKSWDVENKTSAHQSQHTLHECLR